MRYDVFISYSQAADGLLSERVQNGLARFAKPWWRRRALSVFRDQTGLTANPGLWSSIADAIDDSRYFLLLASPEAAASMWVAREVAEWRAKHGSDGMLVVLTDGEIAWDEEANDFDWTASTALSTIALAGSFAEAPRYVDMRWARSEEQLDLKNGRFRDQIAELAAPVRGVSKDELAGEDVRQYRRTLRHAWVAGIALLLMTIAAVAGFVSASHRAAQLDAAKKNVEVNLIRARLARADAITAKQAADANLERAQWGQAIADWARRVADQQTTVAQKQAFLTFLAGIKVQASAKDAQEQEAAATQSAHEASLQAYIAGLQRAAGVARSLFAGSQSAVTGGSPDTGLLLAAQSTVFANQSGGLVADSDEKGALVGALQQNPRILGWLRGLRGQVVAVTVSPDSERAAALSRDGHVAVWRLRDRQLLGPVFPAPGGSTVSDLKFVDAQTLAFRRDHKIIGFKGSPDGAAWTPAWTHDAPDGALVAGIAAARGRLVVAYGIYAVDTPLVFDLFDASDAKRMPTVRLSGLPDEAVEMDGLALSRFGTRFAAVVTHIGQGESGYSSRPKTLDVIPTGPGKQLSAPLPAFESGNESVNDVRFSPDETEIGVLPNSTDVPMARFRISGALERVSQRATNWARSVPDTPIGLGSNLDAVVQRNAVVGTSIRVGSVHNAYVTAAIPAPAVASTSIPQHTIGVDDPAQVGFSPDGSFALTTNGDGVVPVIALRPKNGSHFARFHRIAAPAFARRCFVGCGLSIALTRDGSRVAELSAPENGGRGALRVSSLDGSARSTPIPLLHDPSTVKLSGFEATDGPSTSGSTIAFDDPGTALAVGNGDGSVDIYDTNTGQSLYPTLRPRARHSCEDCVSDILFAGSINDGRIVEIDDGTVETWILHSGRAEPGSTQTFADDDVEPAEPAEPADPQRIAMNVSGTRLLVYVPSPFVRDDGRWDTAESSAVHVFDAAGTRWHEQQPIATGPRRHSSPGLALSPDGRQFALADGDSVAAYDVDTGAQAWTRSSGESYVWYGDDGSVYTSAISDAGTMQVRSPRDGGIEYMIGTAKPGSFPTRASVVAVGSHVIVASDAPFAVADPLSVRVADYSLGIPNLVGQACRLAGRALTHDEWTQYVGTSDQYAPVCSG